MQRHSEKSQENESQSNVEGVHQTNRNDQTFQFVDKRSETKFQKGLIEIANNSYHTKHLASIQRLADNYSKKQQYSTPPKKVFQEYKLNERPSIIQRSGIGDIENLLFKPAPNHKERKGSFKVSARLEAINKKLKEEISDEERERQEAFKRILTNGKSYDAMVRAHEIAKKLPTEELKKLLSSDENIQYERSLERGRERVEFAEKHSSKQLGTDRDNIKDTRSQRLITKMKNAAVTFNFNYNTTSNWSKAQMLNSFEVLKFFDTMSGNLEENVDTRDEIENEQFGIPKGMNGRISTIKNDKEKAQKLNERVPPNLRPKYAALNFAGYNQGSAPSQYYGKSHMIFKHTIKDRCTITGGDSLGDAGGFAGLAFPLTDEGIEGLVEYCRRIEERDHITWRSLDTQSQAEISSENESADNPDWNFIEVQIHGDVRYQNEIEKIVIASSELGSESPDKAIESIKRITNVDNVVVE